MDNQEPGDPLKPNERQGVLLEHVLQVGSAQTDELAKKFGVSRMTIHRDLDALVAQGTVRRIHGGVTVRSSNLVENNFLVRSRLAEREKQAIAQAAAELIQPGQAIIIDDSTTSAQLRRSCRHVRPSPSSPTTKSSSISSGAPRGSKSISLGGQYDHRHNAFYGYICEQAAASLRANTLFMSTSTVFGGVAYHQQGDVVKTKRALMAVADKCILLADSSKFGVSAP